MNIIKTCAKCGSSEFYKTGDCKPCAVKRARIWRLKNPDKAKALVKKWKLNNKDKIKQSSAIYRAGSKEKRKLYYLENKEQIKQKSKEWYKNNTDRAKKTASEWAKKNPGIVNAHTKKWSDNNKEKVAQKNRKWKQENKTLVNIYTHNYRSKKDLNGGELSKGIINKLFILQKGMCVCCRSDLTKVKHHLDHKIPLSRGGLNIDSNVQLLCSSCNLSKSHKDPIAFMQSKGYLL